MVLENAQQELKLVRGMKGSMKGFYRQISSRVQQGKTDLYLTWWDTQWQKTWNSLRYAMFSLAWSLLIRPAFNPNFLIQVRKSGTKTIYPWRRNNSFRRCLNKQHIIKSIEPGGMHTQILWELADVTVRPLPLSLKGHGNWERFLNTGKKSQIFLQEGQQGGLRSVGWSASPQSLSRSMMEVNPPCFPICSQRSDYNPFNTINIITFNKIPEAPKSVIILYMSVLIHDHRFIYSVVYQFNTLSLVEFNTNFHEHRYTNSRSNRF